MAAPINTVTYGTFSFPFANLNCTSGVLYFEDGFTRIGRRYIFSVTGTVGGVSQPDLESKLLQMQDILKTPRLNFRVHWDGDGSTDLFFYVPATTALPGTGVDIDWGPKPGDLNITRFSGGRKAFYQWTVSVNTMDASLKSAVLAATWQWSHSVDASGYTTRTVRGKILVGSGSVASGQGADYYRNVVTQAVPVLAFFKREAQEYSQSEDGRVLSFSVTDTETYYTLPSPITAGHATWMVRLHGIGESSALMVDYILSGWFESSAHHGKSEIVNAIFNLVAAKFGAAVAENSSAPMIFGERVLREDIYNRNRIDFSICAVQAGGGIAADNVSINYRVGLQTFGIQPPDSNGVSININPYGNTESQTSGAFAPAPLPYDADPATGVDQSGGYQFDNAGNPPFVNPPEGQGRPDPPTDSSNNPLFQNLSDRQKKTPFIAFHEVISYQYDNHLVMLVPMLPDADPIVQQVGVPTVKISQVGYSRQIAKVASDIPGFGNPPAFQGPDFSVAFADVDTPVAEPIADGVWQIFTTRWRYVFYKGKQPISDDKQLLPWDPRRPGSPDTAVQIDPSQLPDVIETPET